ncbi:PAS domain-containing protein [Phaeobacter gallaeciensis]|uniref:PAS domain protein n=1 Tax=Phaeobacter gallaeciensis TaxID=60890 RepID=A0AAD0EE50_9RHOB|nr:PAS domain-containing protein [Phaeobacter gallaeciensis]AHD10674.1 PAS domain protein [Phaeobacter gallaeciensis DSM 26640]ATE93937.1 PAS domain protein [Phaeobacter gallaeciensis]ATE96242.1 PAS domain protein [Phaeobacter gallaeciensis]ATF02601.1 PAS domain protein [Phaeobacter gallaeciensis]ATF06981.1 PAS domain protein [Phaeobacter gallaeciensis]
MGKEMTLLGSLLRYSSLPLSLIDPEADELELSFVNSAFEKATGYKADQVIDRPCPLFDGPAVDQSTISELKIARDGCKGIRRTLWNYDANGHPFECLTYIDPITVTPGRVVLLGCHFMLSPELSSTLQPKLALAEAASDQGRANSPDRQEPKHAAELHGLEDQKDELLDYARKALLRCWEMRRNTLYSRIDLYFNRHRGNLLGAENADIGASAMLQDSLLKPRQSQA